MKSFPVKQHLLNLIFLSFLLISCGSPGLEEGTASLIGSWAVYEINYAEGTRTDLGVTTDTSYTQTGDLGSFVFDETEVVYDYSHDLETVSDRSSWELLRATVNCGFNKCEVYTLVLKDLNLTCIFGDDTADAEENATEITLAYESTAPDTYQTYTLHLRK